MQIRWPLPRSPLTERSDWPEGVARHVLAQVDSTNAEAMRLTSTITGPTWILAHQQTAGRGRRGRAWADPPGNFAATLLLRPTGSPVDVSLFSFVAALALHEALAAACGPSARLAIKWPNDVLLNGGKVAGILLESTGQGGSVSALAIGIGVNLSEAPDPSAVEPGAMAPVAVRSETGHTVSAEEFLDLLAPAFARWQAQLETWGFAPIRTAWMARAAKLGQVITARTGQNNRTGTFDGIDDAGALVLTTAAGREVIPAADVYFSEGV